MLGWLVYGHFAYEIDHDTTKGNTDSLLQINETSLKHRSRSFPIPVFVPVTFESINIYLKCQL